MSLYDKVLNNKEYLDVVKKIESMKFISDGKWDWEHGFGHFTRVSNYVKTILMQLEADTRTIDLAMTAALLHDIGLSKGEKTDHALESAEMFMNYIDSNDITLEEENIMRQAIMDHSKGKNIQSLVGLSLVFADKLDVTYHRTINSSIQEVINKETQKIRSVDITINDNDLIVNYNTGSVFNLDILKEWPKAITIPYKIANCLNKNYKFMINNVLTDISSFINL